MRRGEVKALCGKQGREGEKENIECRWRYLLSSSLAKKNKALSVQGCTASFWPKDYTGGKRMCGQDFLLVLLCTAKRNWVSVLCSTLYSTKTFSLSVAGKIRGALQHAAQQKKKKFCSRSSSQCVRSKRRLMGILIAGQNAIMRKYSNVCVSPLLAT